MAISPDDPVVGRSYSGGHWRGVVDAVREALTTYVWRGLTARTVAALVVAVADSARGRRTSSHRSRPVGLWVTPADRGDERVCGLVLVLEATPGWRVMTVQEVARRLVGGLGAVEERALWMDLELEWLLDPPA